MIPPHMYQKGYDPETKTNKCQQQCREIRTLKHWTWKSTMVRPLHTTLWNFHPTKKCPRGSTDPLLEIYPQNWKQVLKADTWIHRSAVHNSRDINNSNAHLNQQWKLSTNRAATPGFFSLMQLWTHFIISRYVSS